MKILIYLTLFYSVVSEASFKKPEMLARYSGITSYNAPAGISCFSSEPQPSGTSVYLGCLTEAGTTMLKWSPKVEILTHAEASLFSHPKDHNGEVSWYEFSEAGVTNLYEEKAGVLKKTGLKNLGSVFALIDSFLPLGNGSYVYRTQEEEHKGLNLWKDQKISPIETLEMGYLFPPVVSSDGRFVAKVRRESISESAPDELVIFGRDKKVILRDTDADPASKIKSFRHQYAIDNGSVALVIRDDSGEAMVIVKDGRIKEVARVGRDVGGIDFFAPKMKNGRLVFRGVDFQKRKVVYHYEKSILKVILTQGDLIDTDLGTAQINYKNQESIFFGAPGISESGDVYQQATLTRQDTGMTLFGIGLLKLKKE